MKEGETILLLEAMKMQNQVRMPFDGEIVKIHVKKDEIIPNRYLMVEIKPKKFGILPGLIEPDALQAMQQNKVDFFIIIHQYIDKEDLNFILTRLNKLPDIQVAAQIDPLKLKSKENLVM